MSGGTAATTIAASVAGSVASVGANALLSGGGGGGSSGGGGQSVTSQQYTFYGPHPSTQPLSGEGEPKPSSGQEPVPYSTEAKKAPVATAREAPTQAKGEQYANQDYQNVWASRLSKYLDYNSRQLG